MLVDVEQPYLSVVIMHLLALAVFGLSSWK